MAVFQILATRRFSLNSSEFDVQLLSGFPSPHEIFMCVDQWVLHDGHLVGMEVECRPMKAAEARRYRKLLTG